MHISRRALLDSYCLYVANTSFYLFRLGNDPTDFFGKACHKLNSHIDGSQDTVAGMYFLSRYLRSTLVYDRKSCNTTTLIRLLPVAPRIKTMRPGAFRPNLYYNLH